MPFKIWQIKKLWRRIIKKDVKIFIPISNYTCSLSYVHYNFCIIDIVKWRILKEMEGSMA